MTIQEAIDILTKWTEPQSIDDDVKLHQAKLLLIEAGKRHREETKHLRKGHPFLLPGETEE